MTRSEMAHHGTDTQDDFAQAASFARASFFAPRFQQRLERFAVRQVVMVPRRR